MCDGLDEFGLGVPVLLGVVEVKGQLRGGAASNERGDGDEAAVTGSEPGQVPHVVEEDVVGALGEIRGDVPDGTAAPADVAGCSI